jgi:HNH endonuclease
MKRCCASSSPYWSFPLITASPRSSETFRYAPVGRCIYCADADSVLKEEHIIPFSLGGTLILPKASCAKCEKITHRFEGVVGREIFGKFRAKHNLPTRRPKERPTHFTTSTSRGIINVSATDHPTELFVYKFKPANALAGFPAEFDTSTHHWAPVAIASKKELNSFKETHDWDGKISVRMRPIEFARMLAKIAHSYAVAELGYGSFRPMVVDLILGKMDNISYAVGGDWESEPPVKDGRHLLSIHYLIDVDRKRAWIVADIRLFSSIGTPTYHVVVGEAENAQHLRTMAEKMGNAESIEVTLPRR